MPTLIEVKVSVPCEELNESDESETILYDESVTLLDGDEESYHDEHQKQNILLSESECTSVSRLLPIKATVEPTTREVEVSHERKLDDSNTAFLPNRVMGERTIDERDESTRAAAYRHDPQSFESNRSENHGMIPSRCRIANCKKAIGPNEKIYRSKYDTLVKNAIQEFDQSNPGVIRNYRCLPPEEQAREQQRVLELLSRLGIGHGSQHRQQTLVLSARKRSPSTLFIDRDRLLNDTLSPFPSSDGHDSSHVANQDSFGFRNDDSVMTISVDQNQSHILLSPSDTKKSSTSCRDIQEHKDPSRHSSESVELARGTMDASVSSCCSPIYDSPKLLKSTNPFKRQASTSAKRGSDLNRIKYNEDVIPPPNDDVSVSSRTMDDVLSTGMGRLSISPNTSISDEIFPASQSPISPKLTYASSSDSDEGDFKAKASHRDSRGKYDLDRHLIASSDDTVDTFTTYNKLQRRAMREIPCNVGMKAGAAFHIEKLDVKRCDMTRQKNPIGGTRRRFLRFRDPLSKYNPRQRQILNEVFESIRRAETDSKGQTSVETSAANVLFSLSDEQIRDLCVKLFLDDEETTRDERHNNSQAALQARTVIITRAKEDTESWERVIREGTGCSVYNHSSTPLSERMRPSTSEKASKFDVILTTYDALKAPDVTVPVDAIGHAILSASADEKGWLASRSRSSQCSRPQACKQLSVLHKLNFQRAIFVDVLGRKTFLAKKGTSRASAAVALRANSRLVFFSRSDADGESVFRALQKSDRQAFQSLSDVLHLQEKSENDCGDDENSDSDDENHKMNALEACSLDLKGLI